jgi:hypothetical protein
MGVGSSPRRRLGQGVGARWRGLAAAAWSAAALSGLGGRWSAGQSQSKLLEIYFIGYCRNILYVFRLFFQVALEGDFGG